MYLTNFKLVIYLTNFKLVMYLTNLKLVIHMTNFKLVKNCNQYRIGRNNQYLIGYVRLTNLNWLQPIKIGHFNQFVFTVHL